MIVPLPNGLFSDPKGLDYIDCVHVFEPAGRCVKGACVPADAAPTCIDWEGMADPTVQGTIDTTDFDADADSKTDQCKEYCLEVCALGVCETVCEESEEVLTEWYCDGAQEMGENKKVSCYHLDPPHVCQDGACVPYEGEDCSECSRPDDPSADPYVSGTLMEVKLQCEEVERPDTCASSTKVKQWVCSGYNGMIPEWKTHDCSADGALCKDGACVMADESLKECIETGDVGVDPDTSGQYQVTNAVGVTSNGGDHCGATGTLFEYYCDDDEVKMVLVDCEDSGKTCVAGACQ